jgi:L-ascorbate metabolism protein UlaG (beta-lactamase superfamily)
MSPQTTFEQDLLHTSAGDLTLHFLGHASLRLSLAGKEIYVDPFGEMADYSRLPPADVILVSHHHADHFDPQAIARIRTEKTQTVLTEACAGKLAGGIVMKNGDARTVGGWNVEAVPAYNIVHKRENGQPFHPRGEGNGYVVAFGDKRLYFAGDTENVPEMKDLRDIECAFLPVNLPYTMSPEMAADAARSFRPRILYPYHYGNTDIARLAALLKDEAGIEVRIRKMA